MTCFPISNRSAQPVKGKKCSRIPSRSILQNETAGMLAMRRLRRASFHGPSERRQQHSDAIGKMQHGSVNPLLLSSRVRPFIKR